MAIGRDYADVPPTRGVYKGEARSELSVAVRVAPADAPNPEDLPAPNVIAHSTVSDPAPRQRRERQVQQQQQQQ